jgi:hypothetical protein
VTVKHVHSPLTHDGASTSDERRRTEFADAALSSQVGLHHYWLFVDSVLCVIVLLFARSSTHTNTHTKPPLTLSCFPHFMPYFVFRYSARMVLPALNLSFLMSSLYAFFLFRLFTARRCVCVSSPRRP